MKKAIFNCCGTSIIDYREEPRIEQSIYEHKFNSYCHSSLEKDKELTDKAINHQELVLWIDQGESYE